MELSLDRRIFELLNLDNLGESKGTEPLVP